MRLILASAGDIEVNGLEGLTSPRLPDSVASQFVIVYCASIVHFPFVVIVKIEGESELEVVSAFISMKADF